MLKATQSLTTPALRPLAGHVFVATNSRFFDRDTQELGEDYAELRQIEVAYRLFMRRLNRGLRRCSADDARQSIKEFLLMAPDAHFDSSFGGVLSRARDAFADARVVRMVLPTVRA